jgi:hypothetical protein
VKFGHALVILGKPIVSRLNEDHLGKKFNVPQNKVVCRPEDFISGPMGFLELVV